MKKISFFITLLAMVTFLAHAERNLDMSRTALLIIDIQQFYFPGGNYECVNPIAASLKAKKLLAKFRQEGLLVVHVRHNDPVQGDIHPHVAPIPGEDVFTKDNINSFHGTGLLEYLRQHQVERLIICGMMTDVCVEAAVRAGTDQGFECILIEDACATMDAVYNGHTVSAKKVQIATFSVLSTFYAQVMKAREFLETYFN